jgi:hypothetical protein
VYKRAGVTDKIGNPIEINFPLDVENIPLTKKPKPVSINKLLNLI